MDSATSLAGQCHVTGWTVPLQWLDSTTSLAGQYHVTGWTVPLHWLDSTTSLATHDLLLVGSTICVTHGQYRCSLLAVLLAGYYSFARGTQHPLAGPSHVILEQYDSEFGQCQLLV